LKWVGYEETRFQEHPSQKQFDHITVVVRDLDAAKNCSACWGFRVDKEVVIAGEPIATYAGIRNEFRSNS
jgi:hypothetical protein